MQGSTKTIIEKLKLHMYKNCLLINVPENLHDFDQLTYDEEPKKESYDLIIVFVFSLEEFTEQLKKIAYSKMVEEGGYVYFAYPKKGNTVYDTYVERDEMYTDRHYDADGYVHNSDLKFSRMVSMNEVFTVVGMKQGRKKPKTANSQSVGDYVGKIGDVRSALASEPETLAFYDSLTPGYQKQWARYIFSAKREETQQNRLAETKELLGQGIKSKDLAR